MASFVRIRLCLAVKVGEVVRIFTLFKFDIGYYSKARF